ncbi:MAG: prepilin-type N-terminal cleavage/methylation domain-containing protein [Acidobacteriota bacterium]
MVTASRHCGGDVAMAGDRGMSFVELVVVMAIVALVSAMAVPLTANVLDDGRARQASGFLASRFRLAQQQAVFKARAVALVFDRVGAHWTFRVCTDGNGNGVLRADIAAGRDRCPEGPYDVPQMFGGVQVDVDARLRGPDGEPGSADPVRFGASDIASFSPAGTCSAGTLFLRSAKGVQYAVRVGNVSGRIRLLRYDPGRRTWA